MRLTTLLLLAFFLVTIQVNARTWTQQATGKTIEADYQGTSGEGKNLKVTLRMAGRGTFAILLSDLSEEDQEWVKQQMTKTAGGEEGATQVRGKWKGYMANSDGERDSPINLEITEDIIIGKMFSGQEMGRGSYRIRGSGKAMRIDVKGTAGEYDGKDYEGIITVEGNTLKWCSTNDNESARRPRDFQTDLQQNHFLMVLERDE